MNNRVAIVLNNFAKIGKFPILSATFGNFLWINFVSIMKGSDLKEFRIINNLTQTDLGDYLGVQKGFISKIENGKDKLPEAKFRKLLNNPHNWDTSMLSQPSETQEPLQSQNDVLIAELRAQIEKLESKVDNLNQELGEKNALLRMISQGGEEIAPNAGFSFSANVG